MRIHTALVTGALALMLAAPVMAAQPPPLATPMVTPSATPTTIRPQPVPPPHRMRATLATATATPAPSPLPSPSIVVPELPPLTVVPAQQLNDLSSALLLTCNVITQKTDLSELLACANNYLHQVQAAHANQEMTTHENIPPVRK